MRAARTEQPTRDARAWGSTRARVLPQVMDQCREVYATRQRSLAEDTSALPKTGKAGAGKDWSAFRVALMAAKRKVKPPSGRI